MIIVLGGTLRAAAVGVGVEGADPPHATAENRITSKKKEYNRAFVFLFTSHPSLSACRKAETVMEESLASQARVQDVPHGVAEEVESKDSKADSNPRPNGNPRRP